MSALVILLLVGQYILAIILCAQYTARHDRGPAMGAVLGFFFGWFALLGLALMLNDEPTPQYSRYPTSSARPSLARQLETLSQLHDRGALTTEEYETEKRKLIANA